MKSEEIFKLSEEKYNFNMTAFSFRCLRMLQIPFYYMKALYRYDLNCKSREQYTGINTDFSNRTNPCGRKTSQTATGK